MNALDLDILTEKLESNGFVLTGEILYYQFDKLENIDFDEIGLEKQNLFARVNLFRSVENPKKIESYSLSIVSQNLMKTFNIFSMSFLSSKDAINYFDFYTKNIMNIYKSLIYISYILVDKIRQREGKLSWNFVLAAIGSAPDDGNIRIRPKVVDKNYSSLFQDVNEIELLIVKNKKNNLELSIMYRLFDDNGKFFEEMNPIRIKTFLGKSLKETKRVINKNKTRITNQMS